MIEWLRIKRLPMLVVILSFWFITIFFLGGGGGGGGGCVLILFTHMSKILKLGMPEVCFVLSDSPTGLRARKTNFIECQLH